MTNPRPPILYQTEDGKTRLEVRLQDESVWFTQAQMAALFDTTKQNIFEEKELTKEAAVRDYVTVQKGKVHDRSRHI
jgi:hypothetical protein